MPVAQGQLGKGTSPITTLYCPGVEGHVPTNCIVGIMPMPDEDRVPETVFTSVLFGSKIYKVTVLDPKLQLLKSGPMKLPHEAGVRLSTKMPSTVKGAPGLAAAGGGVRQSTLLGTRRIGKVTVAVL